MVMSYWNSNKLVPIDEMVDEIQGMPRAKISPVYHPDGSQSKYSIVASEDLKQEFAAVTNKYQLIQHSNVMFKVLDALQMAGLDGNARIKYFGGKAYMDMVFSNMKIEDPTGKDINLGYTVRNSYDSSSGVNLFPFAIRGACSNGMIFKMTPDLGLNIVSIRHMGDIVEKVKLGIKTMLERTVRVRGVFIEMVDRATHNIMEFRGNELELTVAEYTGSPLSARKVLEASSMPLRGDVSQWDIYNALTSYATWNAQSGAIYERIQTGAEKLINTPNLSEVRDQAITRRLAVTQTPLPR